MDGKGFVFTMATFTIIGIIMGIWHMFVPHSGGFIMIPILIFLWMVFGCILYFITYTLPSLITNDDNLKTVFLGIFFGLIFLGTSAWFTIYKNPHYYHLSYNWQELVTKLPFEFLLFWFFTGIVMWIIVFIIKIIWQIMKSIFNL